MRWLLRNLLVFFYAFTVYISYSQIILLAGGYAPVGFVLTPSDMPYAPPLSMVVLAPTFEGDGGWGVRFIDAYVYGVRVEVPVVHYYYREGGQWWEYVPNSRARLGSTPLETALNMLWALLPPWTPAVYPSDPPRFKVLFTLPAWAYVPLMLFALRYKLYYRGRRVW